MIRIHAAGAPVLIEPGLIEDPGAVLATLPPARLYLVTDANVSKADWGRRFDLPELAGVSILPPGERHKTLRQVEALLDSMLEAGLERGDRVVALGGGVVGDMAGLAAALFKRGCGFVQVPTSLLAQVDSAIGGKTGVNASQGKNLIGAFYRPEAVLIDPSVLATLPEAELRSGYAEVVKYGLTGDATFFGWCEENAAALLARDQTALLHAIETCVRAKAAVVERDERDRTGERALLNFGHSFGHAIEAETGIRHGEAVAIGMVLAFRLSAERGLCPPADAERVARHLGSAGLPTGLGTLDPAGVAARLRHDKKRVRGGLPLVLTRGIGRAFLDQSLSPGEVEDFLARAAG